MTLKNRTLVITATTLLGLLVAVFLEARFLFFRRFAELEEREVRQNVERGLSDVTDSLADLSDIAKDYGAWTESYSYLENRNPRFVDLNLPTAKDSSLNIHFVAILDLSGKVVVGRLLDVVRKVNTPLPPEIEEAIVTYPGYKPHAETTTGLAGVQRFPGGLALAASWPILTTDGSGPARGMLILGRFLSPREVERIAQRTHLPIRLGSLDAPDLANERATLLAQGLLVRPRSADQISGLGLLRDPLGAPAGVLQIDLPRAIYAQAKVTLAYVVVSLLGFGLVFGGLNMWLLRKTVLSRVEGLSRRMSEIGARPDLPARVSTEGGDELASLAGSVNQVLETLQESRTKLKDILEHSSNLFFSHDPDHTFTYVSPQTRTFFDCEPDEALVKWTEFTTDHPTNAEGLAATNRAIETGVPGDPYELELLTKKGRRLWVEVREAPVVRNGKTVAIVGAYTDITEQKRAEKLQAAVYWVAHITGSAGEMKDFYQAIQEIVAGLLDVENFCIALANPDSGRLETAYLVSPRGWPAPPAEIRRLENQVARTGEPLWASWDIAPRSAAKRNWLGVPLLRGTSSFGVLSVWSHDGGLNLTDAEKILVFVSQHVATAIEHKQAHEQIKVLAYRDSLTGLPNRVLFNDRLTVAVAHAHREGEQVGVLFLDLDHFKVINDSLGHRVGDSLLQAVARRLLASGREGDTVSRLGGDEFTMLLPGIAQAVDVAKVAQKVLNTVRQPFHIDGHELFLTASIGISLYPEDGQDTETLLKNADASMYRAKEQGRDNYQLCTPAMNATALERLNLENRLRKALAQEELTLFYQPVMHIPSGSVTSFEALLRWKDPQKGVLRPADFMPLAEVTGLIVPMGPWVLRKACAQAKRWQDEGRPVQIAVNLSARHLQQHGFLEDVYAVLEETRLDPQNLAIEITESNAMQNAETTIPALQNLKALGIGIAIDDFGTGYSSLSYLRRLPIDTIKIDQAFVRDLTTDPDDAAIATAVIAMAHTLKLKVVAEGVETEEQLAYLRGQGCDYAQGYLLGRPQPPEECEQFLSKTV
jgi:diguanylate cyclase (GGDEF)-like protein/PAS domain S-box-containing protein